MVIMPANASTLDCALMNMVGGHTKFWTSVYYWKHNLCVKFDFERKNQYIGRDHNTAGGGRLRGALALASVPTLLETRVETEIFLVV
jgi:hypothetical protein